MKDKALLAAFVAASLFAAWWAFYLIGVHYDAVYEIEGGACGPEGGCRAVLQSDDAELPGGIPVSVPAVPMYLLLAVVGIAALREKFDRARLAELATLCGLVGLAFGGWLLFKMVWYLDSICRFCLVMDGSNLAVLALALFLHPDGPGGAFKGLGGAIGRMTGGGPELALAPVVLVGTFVVHGMTERDPPAEPVVEVETPAPAPETTPAPTLKDTPTPRPTPAGRPEPGTKRLVLPEERADLKIDSSVPFKGPKDAPIEIVLFEDFQCPYCKKLTGNIEVLLEDPEYASKVRVGYMHYPMNQACNANELAKPKMHRFACTAAASAVCADRQGKFWPMHDLMFRNSGRLRGSNLKSYAREVGLDMDAWISCVNAPATNEKLKSDTSIGAAAGVRGTPSLFINGRRLVGAQPVASLKAAIDIELEGREGRVLLDVPVEGEVIGDLTGAATSVTFQGPEGPFTIDAFEASIEGGKAVSKPGVPPARSFTWYDAKQACEAAGKRLCTEAEWMQACTGAVQVDEDRDGTVSRDVLQGRQHSYGEHYREGWCADARKSDDARELLTGDHPKCGTPEGVYDLEGVTKEWIGLSADQAVLKGGSYKSRDSARCAYYKDSEAPDVRDDTIGFRCCSGGDPDADAGADEFVGGKVGDAVQAWSGPLVGGGGTFDGASLKGKPYILTFWASWCEPCKKELPALVEAYEQHKAAGLEVIAVNVEKDPAKRDAYLAASPLPFPVVDDAGKAIMNTFQSRGGGIPLSFWVQRDGLIRQRTTGYDDKSHAKFMQNVRDLVAR